MRPGAGQRWRPCRDCAVARAICRQGQAVRDVAGSDQPHADQGCSEMFDDPWDPVFGPSGHHRCVDLGGDVRQAHPPPRPPPVGLTRGARTREKPCRALAARHASVQESGAAARAASHSPASRASSTVALPPPRPQRRHHQDPGGIQPVASVLCPAARRAQNVPGQQPLTAWTPQLAKVMAATGVARRPCSHGPLPRHPDVPATPHLGRAVPLCSAM